MNRISYFSSLTLSCICGLLIFLLSSQFARAENDSIPPDLKPWIGWVLHDKEEQRCTLEVATGNNRFCSWPSTLELEVTNTGAQFTQQWQIETRTLVSLPGNAPYWPEQVTDNNKPLLLSKKNNHPAVWLEPGAHTISGSFTWNGLPEHLAIPAATGLVQLRLHNKIILHPQLDQEGRLWFQQKKRKTPADEDSLNLQIFRKITDNVPLIQEILIMATVSGQPRRVALGLKIEGDFVPLELRSPLPARLDSSNRLSLQLRPGVWEIRLKLRNSAAKSPVHLGIGTIDGPWSDNEIWVFQANPQLRQLNLSGVPAIDPSRTSLPQAWKNLPAYLISKGQTMTFVEKSRGNPSPVPNRLSLRRRLWLDEQGSGLTVSDAISGTMTNGWRLGVSPGLALGRVEVGGTPRLITRLKGSDKIGVEVRQGDLALQADSRIKRPVSAGRLTIDAVGWEHVMQSLSAELNLPPGWTLFTATGIDKVSTWLNRWTLLDIFLVMITALATGRILGWGWGAVSLLTLILSYHQPGFPKIFWLPLLALLGMHRMIAAKTSERIFRLTGLAILIALLIGSVPYMINEIRVGIYPQLELGRYHRITNEYMEETKNMENAPALDESGVAPQKSSLPGSVLSKRTAGYATSRAPVVGSIKKSVNLQVDPHDMIQTGPGLPEWSWKRINLSWNGPVTPEQKITLYLLSPRMNTVLAFSRVLLLLILLVGFLRCCLLSGKSAILNKHTVTTAMAGLFLFTMTIMPADLYADMPSPELLKQLQTRLLTPPKCGTQCAEINSCLIQADKQLLKVELAVDSQITTALPLPGENRFFEQILLDGAEAEALRVNQQGYTFIRLAPGRHKVVLTKRLNNQRDLSFSFPLVPERGQALLKGWSMTGLRNNGKLEQQLTLRALAPVQAEPGESEDENVIQIPAFVQIERTLHLGLKWQATTRILRKSPGTVIAFDIPLLPGEHVTSESFAVQDKHIRITMGPDQEMISYSSSLTPADSLELKAAKTSSWTERWFLDVSPIWHVEAAGVPEINQTNPAGKRFPEYRPYPGEALQLAITRPEGVDGTIITINRSKRNIRPGVRATDTSLAFTLTASRGLQHTITLPPDIDIQKTVIDGREVVLQHSDNLLTFPVRPGRQEIEINWRSKQGIARKMITEPVDLGLDSVNSAIMMNIPSSRWILFTGGPRIGPAVLFWGELLVFILFALLLGRIRITPLNSLQWLLLSLGLSQIPAPFAAIVVAWILLLGVRKDKGLPENKPLLFNLAQIALVLLTLVALGCLFMAIQKGLLGHPDMQIGGNGSTMHALRWYQDRTGSLLPEAWVFSVPLLAYRISMLIWALWLAMALLRWLRWGWDCFSEGGLWKKNRTRNTKKTGNRRKEAVADLEIE
ncbi:MAG: hypothetical protein DSY70_04120 [Desulfobulbus sp.]|nr:MAG: hypothetical protein DSY70_04120 [Desulfobulbus sp.]